MLTRRAVLKGTAAASIAALASAHAQNGAAAAPRFDLSIGNLENGGLAAFDKHPDSIDVFVRWEKVRGADLIFQNSPSGVEVFQKVFDKGWTPVTSTFLKDLSLDGAEGSFSKFDKHLAEFFIKVEGNTVVMATLETNADGVFIDVQEVSP